MLTVKLFFLLFPRATQMLANSPRSLRAGPRGSMLPTAHSSLLRWVVSCKRHTAGASAGKEIDNGSYLAGLFWDWTFDRVAAYCSTWHTQDADSGGSQEQGALVSLSLQARKIHIFKYFLKGLFSYPFNLLSLFRQLSIQMFFSLDFFKSSRWSCAHGTQLTCLKRTLSQKHMHGCLQIPTGLIPGLMANSSLTSVSSQTQIPGPPPFWPLSSGIEEICIIHIKTNLKDNTAGEEGTLSTQECTLGSSASCFILTRGH